MAEPQRVNGDLVTAVIRAARPEWMSEQGVTELAERVLNELAGTEGVIDAEAFRNECYRIVGEINGYRDGEVLAALRELRQRGEDATRQRDQWIARTVAAHDALTHLRQQLAHLMAECEPLCQDTTSAEPVAAAPRTGRGTHRTGAEASIEPPGEVPELVGLPAEVRALIHAVDRMRDGWAEANGERKQEIWRAVHTACDAVWHRHLTKRSKLSPQARRSRHRRMGSLDVTSRQSVGLRLGRCVQWCPWCEQR